MLRPFLVLSLPRSRSAWLAHYLSAEGDFLVGHDISVECEHLSEFLDSFQFGMAGTVETGAVLGWRLFRHRLPESRIVTLHRPIGEIVDSLRKFGIAPDVSELETRAAMLQACASAPGVESLDWRDLSDPACGRWLFEYLLDSPFRPEWFSRLVDLNIQINMLERAKRLWINSDRLANLKSEVVAATAMLSPEENAKWIN